MAGGIDWFRWHHGSVTDPKFGLIAKKAGARVGDVIAVWAFVLESASASDERGTVGTIDAEALEFLLGLDHGMAYRILDAMTQRGLLGAGGRVVAWDKRQPKRERPDDNSAGRTRAYRDRMASSSDDTERHVTPCDATERQETPRGEESRGEVNTSLLSQAPALPPEDRPPLALVEPSKTGPKGPPDCPHQAVLALWAEVLPAMPQHLPSQWRGARADHLRARWRETAVEKGWTTEADGLAYLRRLFAYVGQSAFLTGKTRPREGARPFCVELEWLVSPTNWAKVIEGKYHTEAA